MTLPAVEVWGDFWRRGQHCRVTATGEECFQTCLWAVGSSPERLQAGGPVFHVRPCLCPSPGPGRAFQAPAIPESAENRYCLLPQMSMSRNCLGRFS